MRQHDFEGFLTDFETVKGRKIPFAVVTLVQCQGSNPQEIGARAIIGLEGLISGTIGGGALENHAIKKAHEFLGSRLIPAQFVELNLQKDLGMVCGGVVGLMFEMYHPRGQWEIVIFGAGHVAQALIRALLQLECDITCIDHRKEWLEKLPPSSRIRKIEAEDMAAASKSMHPESFVVIMTMGHKTDAPIVSQILMDGVQYPYIGVIGSETKAKALRSRMSEQKIAQERIEVVRCPIGEPFGNDTPPEIALSVVAQLLKTRDELILRRTPQVEQA